MKNIKSTIYLLSVTSIFVLAGQAIADNKATVSHKHGNRTHTHPLPKIGIKHNHETGKSTKANSSDEWTWIASNKDGGKWDAKIGSIRTGLDNNDERISLVTIRQTDKKNVNFYDVFVTKKDCNRGKGKLTYNDMSRNFVSKEDFIFKGQTLASYTAEILCENFN